MKYPNWFNQAIYIYLDGNDEEAIDQIFDNVDYLLLNEKFEEIDNLLNSIDINLPIDIILSMLTTTSFAKKHFPSRPLLISKLKKLEEYNDLLYNLE